MLTAKTLLLWSGGLDSTWTLSRFSDPIHVLSLDLSLREDCRKRSELERDARHSIRPLFPHHKYKEFKVHAEIDCSLGDCVQVAWWASQYALQLGLVAGSRVLYGGNSDDDIVGKSVTSVQKQTDLVNDIFHLVYRGIPIPEYTWLKPEPSRAQQLKDLGPIADLTWSCRTPKPDQKSNSYIECGICLPCRSINKSVD